MAFSPALIASIIASICEAVVGDVLPESDCSCVEPELSVLLIGADDVLLDPDVSDSVDANIVLVSVVIVLLELVESSDVIVFASGVVLGDGRLDSVCLVLLVGLLGPLVPEVVVVRVLVVVLLGLPESLVLEVVVNDWIASSAA